MYYTIPIGHWISFIVNWLLDNAEPFFNVVSAIVGAVTGSISIALQWLPVWLLGLVIVLLGLWRAGWRLCLYIVIALAIVVGMHLWHDMVETLALVLSATFISLVLGIPLGIAMARSDKIESAVRPVLDLMQTMPAFVYLIPAVMFFGLGKVPGTIATIIFAMPPAVRLTNLASARCQRRPSRPDWPSVAPTGSCSLKCRSPTPCRPLWQGSIRISCWRCPWWLSPP